jgi:hypothetical protein
MTKNRKQYWRNVIAAFVLVLGLMTPTSTSQALLVGNLGNPGVFPPNSKPYGKSYAEWGARWWQWGMELPPAPGHPFFGCPNPPDAGQSGPVWFLAGGPECDLTIPVGKALFFPVVGGVECSSLEDPPFHGDTAAEQRACAMFWGNHTVVDSLFCEIDGVRVQNLARYRFVSPQFTFTAPTPWVFGPKGGEGTAVADSYYFFLTPLPAGTHTLHFGGTVHISVAEGDPFDLVIPYDLTFHLTIAP